VEAAARARAALIEDGENTVLGMVGATWLSREYKARSGR
jgi:hypothetical protein